MAATLAILSLILLVYVYVGYPALCALLAARRRRRVRTADATPSLSVLIAARNEADCIEATVLNKLAQDYPDDLLEVIVVSDASDDGTDEIVARLAAGHPDRVRLLRQEPRGGKTAALTLAAAEARGEVLVFSDANSLYGPGAVRQLVRPFGDSDVGYVTGRMAYRAPDGSLTGEGCSAYMAYENYLRRLETGLGSVVGVDGGIDAVRSERFVSMRPDQQPDFVLPLSVVEAGYRVVHEPGALLYEDALAEAPDEFRMRVRVALRAWHAIRDMASLLLPHRGGLFSWQLFSHKIMRYLAPVFQATLFLGSVLMAGEGAGWNALLIGQLLFYGAALIGRSMQGSRGRWWYVFPYYLCLVNAAAAVALFRFLRGDRQVVWNPRT